MQKTNGRITAFEFLNAFLAVQKTTLLNSNRFV